MRTHDRSVQRNDLFGDGTMNSLTRALIPTGLALLAATSIIAAAPTIAAACGMRVVHSDTDFPERSQLRGHEGTVLINVTLDANGHPSNAEVEHSSGHLLLDLAATRSVLSKWQFDVSHCDHSFPAVHQVAVEYRNDEYR
jgi:protein TonB